MTTREPGAREVFTQGLARRPRSTAFLARRPAPTITWGFDVLVQLVIAATTTSPSARAWCGAAAASARWTARGDRSRATLNASPAPASATRSWGRDGPAKRGLHVGQVERGVLGEDRLDPVGGVPEPLLLRVGLDQGQLLLVTTGEAHVVDGDLVDGEHGARGPVLGAHVADGGTRLERECGHAGSVAFDERARRHRVRAGARSP